MMPSKKLPNLALVFPLLVSACASTVQNYDRHPELSRSRGNFLSGDEAHARGGVGNYVPRIRASAQGSDLQEKPEEKPLDSATTDNAHDQKFGTGPRSAVGMQFLFDTGKAELDAEAKGELNRIAESIRNHDSSPVMIEGFADATGPSDFNWELSKRRANAVRDYLIEQGVHPERIQVKAYGETKAHSDASDPEERKVTITG